MSIFYQRGETPQALTALLHGFAPSSDAAAFVAADSALDRYVAGHPGAESREVAAEGALLAA